MSSCKCFPKSNRTRGLPSAIARAIPAMKRSKKRFAMLASRSRLAEQGRADAATPTSLAKYAVAQIRGGRRVGCALNIKDVSSEYCQQRKGVRVRNLHRWDHRSEEWTEMVVEDRHSTPAELAAFRIDFRAFLKSLSRRDRKVALKMARGHATSWIAKKFKISAARVSQLRRELDDAWQEFQGDPAFA